MDSRALLPAYRPAPNPFRFIAPAIHKFLFNLICHHCYGNRAERSAARVTHDRAPPQRLSFFRLSSMRASFRHLQADERLLPSSSPPLRRSAITRNGHFAAFAHALNAPLRRDRTIPNPFPSRRSEGSSEVEWTREGTRCHFLRIKISQICESDAFADCGSFLLPPSLSLSLSLSLPLPPSLPISSLFSFSDPFAFGTHFMYGGQGGQRSAFNLPRKNRPSPDDGSFRRSFQKRVAYNAEMGMRS